MECKSCRKCKISEEIMLVMWGACDIDAWRTDPRTAKTKWEVLGATKNLKQDHFLMKLGTKGTWAGEMRIRVSQFWRISMLKILGPLNCYNNEMTRISTESRSIYFLGCDQLWQTRDWLGRINRRWFEKGCHRRYQVMGVYDIFQGFLWFMFN
jgi:hypothetical protein